jgi:hypothetical protein
MLYRQRAAVDASEPSPVEALSHFMAMTLYYERQGWGVYTTDQEWDRISYAEHGWE